MDPTAVLELILGRDSAAVQTEDPEAEPPVRHGAHSEVTEELRHPRHGRDGDLAGRLPAPARNIEELGENRRIGLHIAVLLDDDSPRLAKPDGERRTPVWCQRKRPGSQASSALTVMDVAGSPESASTSQSSRLARSFMTASMMGSGDPIESQSTNGVSGTWSSPTNRAGAPWRSPFHLTRGTSPIGPPASSTTSTSGCRSGVATFQQEANQSWLWKGEEIGRASCR